MESSSSLIDISDVMIIYGSVIFILVLLQSFLCKHFFVHFVCLLHVFQQLSFFIICFIYLFASTNMLSETIFASSLEHKKTDFPINICSYCQFISKTIIGFSNYIVFFMARVSIIITKCCSQSVTLRFID